MTDLSKEFGKTKTDITWGITLVLMFRSIGSIIFGIASDRYGRKWPFIINNVLFIVLELVSHKNPPSFECASRLHHLPPSVMPSLLPACQPGASSE